MRPVGRMCVPPRWVFPVRVGVRGGAGGSAMAVSRIVRPEVYSIGQACRSRRSACQGDQSADQNSTRI